MSENNNQVLTGTNLRKIYGDREVVKGISIEVKRGEVVGLLGPNGAGKTTTFYMITGVIRPNEGSIMLNGTDMTKFPMYKRARHGIGYLAQEPSVFTKLSVEENLKLVLEMTTLKKSEQSEKLEKLLEDFSISHIRKSKAYTLSGGERRRTEIARALVMEPDFILLDEPFSGIDPIAVEDIQQIVFDLKSRNIGVLITDHNVRETLTITDRAYLLYEGKILKSGSAREMTEDEEARRLYLGSKFKMDFSGV
ncbi:MAG: LPS export ABC transporter ATP-binding protein [Candidatus Marinimicrobia bacterium]|jgi:lipopolysaccharide export system ATP-binding protein|nr:LPS export ABC transporter ATP-binding protein [Candidatus Neomarinimicrobiota bacterium]MDP6853421.1 LPS export ABC transporter ATP-binding protein [Candidatus Neomarinimicrobiota bacterium]MDP6936746.1 LPS export ABC transporter ATP-binding protein [Candidatus Neomarinimicrobiota bacterium]